MGKGLKAFKKLFFLKELIILEAFINQIVAWWIYILLALFVNLQ
jgi:hypothetical protein